MYVTSVGMERKTRNTVENIVRERVYTRPKHHKVGTRSRRLENYECKVTLKCASARRFTANFAELQCISEDCLTAKHRGK